MIRFVLGHGFPRILRGSPTHWRYFSLFVKCVNSRGPKAIGLIFRFVVVLFVRLPFGGMASDSECEYSDAPSSESAEQCVLDGPALRAHDPVLIDRIMQGLKACPHATLGDFATCLDANKLKTALRTEAADVNTAIADSPWAPKASCTRINQMTKPMINRTLKVLNPEFGASFDTARFSNTQAWHKQKTLALEALMFALGVYSRSPLGPAYLNWAELSKVVYDRYELLGRRLESFSKMSEFRGYYDYVEGDFVYRLTGLKNTPELLPVCDSLVMFKNNNSPCCRADFNGNEVELEDLFRDVVPSESAVTRDTHALSWQPVVTERSIINRPAGAAPATDANGPAPRGHYG